MASRRSGSRVKPYCLTVKTYTANTATGKLSRKNIRISSNKQDLSQQEVSLPVSECLPNVNSEKFVANDLAVVLNTARDCPGLPGEE